MISLVQSRLADRTNDTRNTTKMILGLWETVNSQLWREDFWLPDGLAWSDLRSTDKLQYPNPYAILVYPLVLGAIYTAFCRTIVGPCIMAPLADAMDVPNRRVPPPKDISLLEGLYRKYRNKLPIKALGRATEATGLTMRQVDRWLRQRYKVTGHLVLVVMGVCVMAAKPWLWNIQLCWLDYPYHALQGDVCCYFVMVLAMSWHHTASEFLRPDWFLRSEGKKADRIMTVVQHVLAVVLTTLAWTCNFVRVGSLVLLLHHNAEVLFYSARMCRYGQREGLASVLFPVAYALWLVTRLGLYPFWLMHSVFLDATHHFTLMPSAYVFAVLLTVVLVLDVARTWRIVGVMVKKMGDWPLVDYRSSEAATEGEEWKEE